MSADGSTIVGYSTNASNQYEAFRWAGGVMQGLGFVDGGGISPFSFARSVSADGSTIVGYSTNAADRNEAFRWTQSTGMQSIQSLLAANGVDIGMWRLLEAVNLSADGTIISGSGADPLGHIQPWLVRYVSPVTPPGPPSPPPGFLSVAELSASINDMNRVLPQAQGEVLSALDDQRFIAFEQCAPYRIDKIWCASITGTGSFWSGGDREGRGTAGLSAQVLPGLRLGANLNLGRGRFDLRLGGSNDIDSYGGSLYAAYQPSATGLRLLGAVSANHLDLDITRVTLNGISAIASSRGSRNGDSLGALASIGWTFGLTDRIRATPFADLQWSRVNLGSYAEAGGPFPIAWTGQGLNETVGRLGSELRWSLTDELELSGSAAWAHRLAGKADVIEGTLIGLNGIAGVKTTLPDNWAEVSVGARWKMTQDAWINASLGASIGQTDRPNFSTRIGLAVAF